MYCYTADTELGRQGCCLLLLIGSTRVPFQGACARSCSREQTLFYLLLIKKPLCCATSSSLSFCTRDIFFPLLSETQHFIYLPGCNSKFIIISNTSHFVGITFNTVKYSRIMFPP